MSVRIPKELQDWLNLLLGIWICVSPWPLRFVGDAVATENAVGVGFLVIAAEMLTFTRLRALEEWINIGLGAWLALSPWVLTIEASSARLNFVLSGLAIGALAVYELWDSRRNPARRG